MALAHSPRRPRGPWKRRGPPTELGARPLARRGLRFTEFIGEASGLPGGCGFAPMHSYTHMRTDTHTQIGIHIPPPSNRNSNPNLQFLAQNKKIIGENTSDFSEDTFKVTCPLPTTEVGSHPPSSHGTSISHCPDVGFPLSPLGHQHVDTMGASGSSSSLI